jgi:hypothetical protein
MKGINIYNFRLLEVVVIAEMIKLGIKKAFAQIMGKIQYKEKSSLNFLNYFAKKCNSLFIYIFGSSQIKSRNLF